MAQPLNACGVLLAGGQSSRMGTNKAMLDFRGQPLIQRLADRFRALFPQVILVTNSPDLYTFLDLPMVGDRVPGLGPLGGLEAGLSASNYPHTFFAACDMPFLSEGLIRHMVEQADGVDVVVPYLQDQYEPMHAVYSAACRPVITELLDARRLRLVTLYDRVQVRTLGEDQIRPFGDPEKLFFNCNTPADLARALAWE